MFTDVSTPMYSQQSFQNQVPGFQPLPGAAGQRTTYQPEQFYQNYSTYGGQPQPPNSNSADGFGSLNATVQNSANNLSPNPATMTTNRKNRRESSMLGLGVPGLVQQRKSAVIRDTSTSRAIAEANEPQLSLPEETDGPMAKGLW
jgi:hypothetical protein